MSSTLAEVAERTGRTQAVIRKHIERGKLKADRIGGRVVVEDEDLEAYLASDIFEEAADAAQAGKNGWEVGNIIARLPPRFATAILEGMPSSKRTGTGIAWEREAATAKKNPRPYPTETDDPHWGFNVGHEHVDQPRWKRTSEATWAIGDATWSWDPKARLWHGGGVRDGVLLSPPFSPAHPDTQYRPLGPSNAVSNKPAKSGKA